MFRNYLITNHYKQIRKIWDDFKTCMPTVSPFSAWNLQLILNGFKSPTWSYQQAIKISTCLMAKPVCVLTILSFTIKCLKAFTAVCFTIHSIIRELSFVQITFHHYLKSAFGLIFIRVNCILMTKITIEPVECDVHGLTPVTLTFDLLSF